MANQFDKLLTHLGTGRWNFLYFIMCGFQFFMEPQHSYNAALMAPQMKYTCLLSDNNNSIVIDQSQCSYSVNDSSVSQHISCSSWTFHNSTFASTMTSEFNLVCSDGISRAYFTSLYMAGNFLGMTIAGIIGDKFGRKTVVMGAALLFIICGNIIYFLHNFTAILVARFFMGFAQFPACYILALEVCESKWRSTAGIFMALPWAFGVMMLGAYGYLFRDWRNLQLVISLPLFILIPLVWILDESPRWLIVKGRHNEALKVLRRAARLNNSTLPSEPELRTMMKQIQNEAVEEKDDSKNKKSPKKICLESTTTLCSTWSISKIFLITFTDFFVVSMVFYGLSLSGSSYSDDPYIYLVLTGLMEVPAYSICAPIISKFGRRVPVALGYLISGAALISLTFIPPDVGWLVMLFALVGKLCIAAAYQMAYVYIAELFPTVVRNQAVGYLGLGARIGSVLSPFIIEGLGPYVSWGPSVIFGVGSLLAGVITFALHETNNLPLPDTIEDLEEIINSQKKIREPDDTKSENEMETFKV